MNCGEAIDRLSRRTGNRRISKEIRPNSQVVCGASAIAVPVENLGVPRGTFTKHRKAGARMFHVEQYTS
jgi:hypothetical protein